MPLSTAEIGSDDAHGRQTGSLAGLAVALLLIVIGLYLINNLRAGAVLQDCVISGHPDCVFDTDSKSLSIDLD